MRRLLLWGIGGVLVATATLFSYKIYTIGVIRANSQIQTGNLPDLQLVTLDSSVYCIDRSLRLIIFFDPFCEICQEEADDLARTAHLMQKRSVLLISSSPILEIKRFAQRHCLSQSDVVTFSRISPDLVFPSFGGLVVPHAFVYGTDGKLLREFKGLTRMQTILKYL